MSGQDRSRVEQLRALLEEIDRVRRESERVTSHLDRTLKQPFWPDRRRTPRIPSPGHSEENTDAA
jgi:hypothetical protein